MQRIGRVLAAAPFIVLGLDAAREPGARVDIARGFGVPEPELAVRANGAGMVAGGVAVALGIMPRLAAVGTASLMVPTTLAAHAYWRDEDPATRTANRIQFWKNVGLVGGLLAAAARGGGEDPSGDDHGPADLDD